MIPTHEDLAPGLVISHFLFFPSLIPVRLKTCVSKKKKKDGGDFRPRKFPALFLTRIVLDDN